MSDFTKIEFITDGDWRQLAGVLIAAISRAHFLDKSRPRVGSGAPGAAGYTVTIYDGRAIGRDVATVHFGDKDGQASIVIKTTAPYREEWEAHLTFLQAVAVETENVRSMVEPSYDEAIQRYYRSRAAGSRKTLRQIAEEEQLSYAALRIRKMAYDRAGKWGAGQTKRNS